MGEKEDEKGEVLLEKESELPKAEGMIVTLLCLKVLYGSGC